MLDRTKDNGYAQTSINGVYPGMFCRDASIQMMMHVEAGDYNQALRVLQYTVDYHKKHGFSYVLHVMNNKDNPITDKDFPISDKIQADTTFSSSMPGICMPPMPPTLRRKPLFWNLPLSRFSPLPIIIWIKGISMKTDCCTIPVWNIPVKSVTGTVMTC
jgi:hypothetical protein